MGAVRLIHVFPSITVILGSVVLLIVAHRGVPSTDIVVRAIVVVTASQVAVGALNDFVDRHDDGRTQPEKPLPSTLVGTKVALAMVATGIAVCGACALTFGPTSFAIALIGLVSGLAYDVWLKRTPFSPVTYMISFLSLLTWIWLIAGTLSRGVFLLYPPGACLLLVAHLANALPDARSDAQLGQRGLVVVLGPRRSLQIVLLISAAAAVCACIMCVVEGTRLGILSSVLSGILTACAASVGLRTPVDRHGLQVIFKCIAPAIVLVSVACLLALEAAT